MNSSDFITIEKQDGIANVWLDLKGSKKNIVSPTLMGYLEEMFDELQNDDEIKAAVIISGKDDFMAGADIKAFAIEKEGDFRPIQAKGHEGLARLESGSKPVVSAVHGAAVGLGTELSLACHAIVCSNSPRTKFALPEVMLGLLPGGGGTQRLPKRVGIQKGLDMMLTGRNIFPSQAKKMGLVDEITDEHKLLHVARAIAAKLIKGYKPAGRKISLLDKLLEGNSFGRSIVFKQARKLAFKKSQGNYPAIPAIIDCVEAGFKGGNAGYEKELELFEKLMLTPESEALRSLFFMMTDNKKNPFSDHPKKLNRLGMIGAGFMGAGIAEVSVTKGIDVLLKDIEDEVLVAAKTQVWKSLAKKLKRKSISKIQAEEQIARLIPQLSYDNYETTDIVIEAVLEEMSLKKRIIADIEKHCKDDVIIATNTSSLSVTEMAECASKPELVIGMHYFSPVPKMPLLEIVKTPHTSAETIASCYDFGTRQGKTCIVVNDGPGFYVNRILAPYLNECLVMIDEGIAFDVIDKALIKKGFPVGPITLLDEVGLDIAAHVTNSVRPLVSNRPGFEIAEGVINMAKDGRLGKKNKKGFYKYEGKRGKKSGIDKASYNYFKGDGTKSLDLAEIQDRAICLMLNEAIRCLEENIISNPKDGDLGAVFGIGFLPFTGGPFRAMDTWGVKKIHDRMCEFEQKYGERFEPTQTLVDKASSGSNFHS